MWEEGLISAAFANDKLIRFKGIGYQGLSNFGFLFDWALQIFAAELANNDLAILFLSSPQAEVARVLAQRWKSGSNTFEAMCGGKNLSIVSFTKNQEARPDGTQAVVVKAIVDFVDQNYAFGEIGYC